MNDDLFIIAMFAVLTLTVVIAIHIINKLLIRDFGYPPITLKSLWDDLKSFIERVKSFPDLLRKNRNKKIEEDKKKQTLNFYNQAYPIYADCVMVATNNLRQKYGFSQISNYTQVVNIPNIKQVNNLYRMLYRVQIISVQNTPPAKSVAIDFQRELNVICYYYGVPNCRVTVYRDVNNIFIIEVEI